ncbi:hypothetical protein SBC1_76280 (plasmid) [Caballeronia sp. SBC1]|nr:hypothetical protein SBC2_79460 [Caballeronia sp. SBC2]QIN67581.1 hypothetical protein SBC1_76280 [Caballeronia sp. SBC1]
MCLKGIANHSASLSFAASLRRKRDAALVEARRSKSNALMVASMLRADAELSRREYSRLTDQKEPPMEVMLWWLVLAGSEGHRKLTSGFESPMFELYAPRQAL